MEAKEIRHLAREHLSPSWGLSIGVAAIAALLGGLIIGTSFLPQFKYTWEGFRNTHEILRNVRVSTYGSLFGLCRRRI